MTDEKHDAESALAAVGVGPAAKEAYVDLIRPAAKVLGRDLETVARAISVAMSPLRGLVWGMEKVQDWLATSLLKRLASAPPEEIQTPPTYVAGQVLLQVQFCADQHELREMYANLLASAMLKNSLSSVHPAFVQVIQQLTPDEALLLGAIAQRGRSFSVQESVTIYGRYENKEGSVSEQFRRICIQADVANPALSEAYLDNLLRLKILSEQRWSEGELEPAESNRYGYFDASVKNISGKIIEISAFGEHFIRTCVLPTFQGWHVCE